MVLEVRADRELCIGSENCARYAPRTFHTDEEGKVVFTKGGGDSDEEIRNAVQGCPVGALALEHEPSDADG